MKLRLTTSMLFGAVIAVTSCGDNDPAPTTPMPAPGTVVLEMQHTVDGEALELDEVRYQNAAGQTYSVVDLKYFLSDVVLRRSDGVLYGLDRALYNDVEDPATLQHRLEDVPPGIYESITFTWGLDEDKNVPAGLPDNPQNNNMVWPLLGGGYHYSKCEGFYVDAQGAETGYATHMGRVQRDDGVEIQNHHHFFTTTRPITLTVDGKTSTVPIVMDVNQWYENPNTYDFPVARMIMDDLGRQQMLMENGPSVFSIGTISTR